MKKKKNVVYPTRGCGICIAPRLPPIVEYKTAPHKLKKWTGKQIKDTYNGKPVIDFEGKPLFAELAILELYKKVGWKGVWVDTYRKKYWIGLPENSKSIELPKDKQEIIDKITKQNGKFSGCWDLFIWRNSEIKFIEAKRIGKDAIRDSQLKWRKAAVKAGFDDGCFWIFEWDIE